MSDTLPPNTGFVAAAYVVFVALLLIYVTIMSVRASRLERELQALLTEADGESTAVVEETVAVEVDGAEASR